MSLYYDYPMFSQELVLDLERSRGSDISQLISQFEMPRISCGEKCWNSLYLPAESIFFKYRTMEKRATRNVYCLECKIMRLNTCLNTLHDDRIFIYSSFALLDIFTLAFLDDVRDQKPARFKPEKLAEESLSDNARQRGSRLLPIFQEAVKELYSGSIYAPTRRQGPTPVCGLTAPE